MPDASERIIDATLYNHGSVVLLDPHTTDAKEWIDEHVHTEGWQWFGGSLAIEPRYAQDVIDDMESDGLSVVTQ